MASKKDIGKVFSDQLKDFEEFPTKVTWENIEAELKNKESYRISYWIVLIGLLLIIMGIIVFFKNPKNPDNIENLTTTKVEIENCVESSITQTDKIKKIDNENIPISFVKSSKTKPKKANIGLVVDSTNTKDKNISILINSNYNSSETHKNSYRVLAKNQIAKSKITKETNKKNQSHLDVSTKTTKQNQSNYSNKESEQKAHITLQISNFSDTNEDLGLIKPSTNDKLKSRKNIPIKPSSEKDSLVINKSLKPKDSINLDTPNNTLSTRLSIQAHIIPIYNIVREGSLIDNSLSQNSNSGNISLGYGITLKSHLNKQLYSRIGYNQFRIRNELKNIKTDTPFLSVLNSIGIRPTDEINRIINNREEINIAQSINYHEITMELGYDLIEKKINVSLIGGVSLVIVNNSTITVSSVSNIIGRGRNSKISKTNFSANLGASFQYKLSKKIYFNVEPIIKYQLQNASNNSTSYNPFYLTMQTGFSYQF